MKLKLENQYPEDINSRYEFMGLVVWISWGIIGIGIPKFLCLILAVAHSISLVWMPWRLERRLKKLAHPDLQAQQRLKSLRWDKWCIPIFVGLLWVIVLANLFL